MRILDLIEQLNTLYNSYDDEYKSYMGEPEIMIDVFKEVGEHHFQYAGFCANIQIHKSSDGVYDILNAFVPQEILDENS